MYDLNQIQTDRIKMSLYSLLGKELINSILEKRIDEIMLNPDGNLFVKFRQSKLELIRKIDSFKAATIVRSIASLNNKEIAKSQAVIDCDIEFLNARFSAVMPPLVKAPIFCLRSMHSLFIRFDDLTKTGFLNDNMKRVIYKLILDKKNILVCGQTSCGKTTFINSLLNLITSIDNDTRIVSIEDTPELKIQGLNTVNLYTSKEFDMSYLVKASLRLSPDRIVVGEIRSKEALDMVDAMSTGHEGCICTMHASSATQCLERLKLLISRNDNPPKCIESLIAGCINAIIVLKKEPIRHVDSIVLINGFENNTYKLQKIGENHL